MSEVFDCYHAAHKRAIALARATNLDVAIRRVREYGRERLAVSLACVNDSDYARAEIVRPSDPRSTFDL